MTIPLHRRLLAEFLGTGLLVAVVVGSGIAAQQLSPDDVGLQLLENTLATVFGLAVLITLFGPVSGAHFNPVVTLADWWLQRFPARDIAPYVAAQTAGAIGGAVLANVMFETDQGMSTKERASGGHLVAEVVATSVLILLIFALVRTARTVIIAPLVASYIGAAYWFTSSTSFANPAVTVGRMFSDTFAGIDPSSAPAFVGMQWAGGLIGLGLVLILFPTARPSAEKE